MNFWILQSKPRAFRLALLGQQQQRLTRGVTAEKVPEAGLSEMSAMASSRVKFWVQLLSGLGLLLGSPHLDGFQGWPPFAAGLAGCALLYRVRLHHSLADLAGVVAILLLLLVPILKPARPVVVHLLLFSLACLSLFAGRSGWGTR